MDNNRNFLKSFFTEHWKYMAVASACKIGFFDCLEAGALSCNELAEALKLNPRALQFLLSALCNSGFLAVQNDVYELTELSELLTEHHPETLKYACLNWFGEHMNAWQDLPKTLSNGKSYFENNFGTGFFDYLSKTSEKLHQYHLAMYEYAKDDYKELPLLVDWSQHKSIMDVGGGYGACIAYLKASYPEINCYLFDLPEVINKKELTNITTIAGDFFHCVPSVSESIILSRVLHDWDDKKSKLIVSNCYLSLPTGGYLYVLENCRDSWEVDLSLLNLNMSVICESFERTISEYNNIVNDCGFHFVESIELNTLQSLLIYKK